MIARPARVLVVGLAGSRLGPLIDRLGRDGWGSYSVDSIAEARTVLRTLQFDVILATEHLIDGTGYELSQEIARRSASLFVEVSLSKGHVWLPVVERGTRTMGESAFELAELDWELKRIFSDSATLYSPVATIPDRTQSTAL
ncbi:MAG: hypothetical protein ACRD59_12600 [Candidatus Acidiferrales bacterium]